MEYIPKYPIDHIYYHIISNSKKINKNNSEISYKPELDRIVNEFICKDKPYNVGESSDEDKPYNVGESSDEDKPYNVGESSSEDKPYNVGESSSEDKPYNVGESSSEDKVMNKLYNDLYSEIYLAGSMSILRTDIVTRGQMGSVCKNLVLLRKSINNEYYDEALIILDKLKCYPFNPKYIEFYKNTIDLLQNKYVNCDLLIELLEELSGFLNPIPFSYAKLSYYLILISNLLKLRKSPYYKEYYPKIIGYYEKNFNDEPSKIDKSSLEKENKHVDGSSNEDEPRKVARLSIEDESPKVGESSNENKPIDRSSNKDEPIDRSSKKNEIENKYSKYNYHNVGYLVFFFIIKKFYYIAKYFDESKIDLKCMHLLKCNECLHEILSLSFDIFILEKSILIHDKFKQYHKIIDLFLKYKSTIIDETKNAFVPKLYALLLNAMLVTHNVHLMTDIINVVKEMGVRKIPVSYSQKDRDNIVKEMTENYKTINSILKNVKRSRDLILGIGMKIIEVDNFNSHPKLFKDFENKSSCLFCHQNLVRGMTMIECVNCEKYIGHLTCVDNYLLYLTSLNEKPMCVSCRHKY
jgi:hypothetical protein